MIKASCISLLLLLIICMLEPVASQNREDDFAEFDHDSEADDAFSDVEVASDDSAKDSDLGHLHVKESQSDDKDEQAEASDEQDEFDPYSDEEEFEGYDREKSSKAKVSSSGLKITKVPAHLRAGWQGFYMEFVTLLGIAVYAASFFAGKSKNSKLATSWFKAHKSLLEQHFSIVGDDGMSSEPQSGVLVKESESVYTLWCTGRQCCEGMLVEIKLLKRHDLVSVMSQLMRPISDVVKVTVYMDDEEMDNFVFAMFPKKNASRRQKDLQDLSYFCGDRKSADRYGFPNHVILTESGEVVDFVLNAQTCSVLKKYEDCFESLHFSDQFVGPKKEESEDDGTGKMKKPKKVLMFEFKIPGRGRTRVDDMGATEGLVRLVLNLVDRMRSYRLSQLARAKSDKKRREVEQSFLKLQHAQRQEAAQTKREEKIRAEKDKMMAETDPEKQRKMEEAMSKRDAKKRGPKVKSLKVRM